MPSTRERGPTTTPPTPRPATRSPSRAPLPVIVAGPHPSIIPSCGSPSCVPLPLPSPPSQIPRRRASRYPTPEPRSPPLLSLRRHRLRLRREPAIRWRRGGIITPSPSSTTAISSPAPTTTTTSRASLPPKRRPHNPPQHPQKHNPKPPPHPPRRLPLLITTAIHPAPTQPPIPLLPRLRQQQPIVHATAPLQHVRVVCRCEALADDIRGAELEFGGEGGGAGPLDVFGVVVGALVLAAEDGGLVVGAGGAVAG